MVATRWASTPHPPVRAVGSGVWLRTVSGLQHHHRGADRHAIVEVDNVVVEQPDAAARYPQIHRIFLLIENRMTRMTRALTPEAFRLGAISKPLAVVCRDKR